MASTEIDDLIGTANEADRIMEISEFNSDVTSTIHAVEDNAEAIFTWDYEKGSRPRLDTLYEKAKTSQWNAQTDLDWSIEVDLDEFAVEPDPLEIAYYAENTAGQAIQYDPHAYPYFCNAGVDCGYMARYQTWTPRLLRAAYNFQVAVKDPGGYTHNGDYIIQLLHDSIMDLNSINGTTIPTLVRP